MDNNIGPFPIVIWKEILDGPRSKYIINLVSDLVNISMTCKSLYNLIWNTPNILMSDPKYNKICPTCNKTFHEAIKIYGKLQHNIKSFFSNDLPNCYLSIVLGRHKCPCLYCKEFTDDVIYKQLINFSTYNGYQTTGLIFSLSSLSPRFSTENSIVLAVRYVQYGIYRKSLIHMKYDHVTNRVSFCLLLSHNFSNDCSDSLIFNDNNCYYQSWDNFVTIEFNGAYQYNLNNLGKIYQDYQDFNYIN